MTSDKHTDKNLVAIIESMLFVHGEPLSLARLSSLSQASEDEVRSALAILSADYEKRGIILVRHDNTYQLASHPSCAPYIEALAREEFTEELSRAAMETMAVIAYQGPLARASIDYIRGVNSSYTVRSLLMRGLIERMENPKDSRTPLYRASIDFLRHLGVARMEDLPDFMELTTAVRDADAGIQSEEKPQTS